jgi:hypothetical protein
MPVASIATSTSCMRVRVLVVWDPVRIFQYA